jgi:hypothetical protein
VQVVFSLQEILIEAVNPCRGIDYEALALELCDVIDLRLP